MKIQSEVASKKIAMLCTLAGVPEKAAGFIANDTSVQEVARTLLKVRANKAAPAIAAYLPVDRATPESFVTLSREALASAKKKGMTKEQAISDALLANPEVYEHYLRVEHAHFQDVCRNNRRGQALSPIESYRA